MKIGAVSNPIAATAVMFAVRARVGLSSVGCPVQGPVAGVTVEACCRILHPADHSVPIVAVHTLKLAVSHLVVIYIFVVIQNHFLPGDLKVQLSEESRNGSSSRFVDFAGIEDSLPIWLSLWRQLFLGS